MIFRPELVKKILAGEKTVTRRPAKYDGDGEPIPCRYQPGKTYALQPGRGKKGVGQIYVRSVRDEPIMRVCGAGEAQREGFDDSFGFLRYWGDLYGEIPDPFLIVHRIEFELAAR